jgi:hypothetical protein
MATKAKPNDIVSLREALNMEIIVNQALIDVLVAKGLITKKELLAKIDEIRLELSKVILKGGRYADLQIRL